MITRFVSLKWKLLLLMSAIFFIIAIGVSWLTYLHGEQQLQHRLQEHQQQSIKQLNTQISSAQQRLIKQLEYLTLLVKPQTQAPSPDQLRTTLNLHFARTLDLWNLDQFQIHSAAQGLILQKGSDNPRLQGLSLQAISTERPAAGLSCDTNCRILAAVPIMLAQDEIGSLSMSTSIAEIILQTQQRSDEEVGVLLQQPSSTSSSLPEWRLDVVALSNKKTSLPLLTTLARNQDFAGEGSYQLQLKGKYIEALLIPIKGIHENQKAFWIQIADISSDYAAIKNAFIIQLTITLGGLLGSGLLLVFLLHRPLDRLAHVASCLPSLARRDFNHIREQLQQDSHLRHPGSTDELSMLVTSTLRLTNELERLDREMRSRNIKLKRKGLELSRQNDFVSGLLDNAQAVILVQDSQGRCKSLNKFGRKLFGYSETQTHQRLFSELFGTLDNEQAVQLDDLYSGFRQLYRYQTQCLDAQGNPHSIAWIHSSLTQQDRSNSVLSIGMDITEQMQVQKQLQWLANHDSLTQLPNRSHLQQQLGGRISQARITQTKLAVLFCDLDNFKQINDSLGHPVGDALLTQVAERLTTLVRRQDMVARLGGDEFVILLDDLAQSEDATRVADKILRRLEPSFKIDQQELFVSASIGIAFYPQDGDDATTLIKHADIAMYQSKAAGRKRFSLYTPEQSIGLEERLNLGSSLRHGLGRNEFVLYYQPQLDIDAKRVIGVEALIRWIHPTRGMVPPDKFISLAEETGQIIDIGRWVIQEACAQLKRWEKQGIHGLRMAINLAGPQIMSDQLIGDVCRTFAQTGVNPELIELEITEGFIMSQPEDTIIRLMALKELGISLSIDDFGTGYSSLSYLKKLPVDKLKIDKSFVFDIGRSSSDEAIAKAVIALGQSMNLKVIAEGVEELQHIEFMRSNGCNELQGFYFSKPLPADECARYILAYQRPSALPALTNA
jgi:diguanylate cyclase (GGDEF)-like protein/PAS domain S-box-containing protein